MKDSIVAPDNKRSVSELRSWLSHFGEKNRDHYEQGQVQKASRVGRIRQRIQQLEIGLCSASSFSTASTETSPKKATSLPHIDAPNKQPKEYELMPAPMPVFRLFDQEEELVVRPAEGPVDDSTHQGPYRLVAIRKVLEPPSIPNENEESPNSWYEDDLEDFLGPWPTSTSTVDPDALGTFVLDEERTVHSASEAVAQALGDLDMADTIPCNTSSFSDPGAPVSGSDPNRRKLRKKEGFRKKLPLFLCKPAKEKSGGRRMTSLAPKFVKPQLVVRENSTASTGSCDDDCRSHDATMGEIFASEFHSQRRQEATKKVVHHLDSATTTKAFKGNNLVGSNGGRFLSPQTTSVKAVVRQFGGRGRKNAVQRRKEALERKWAENRAPVHAKKVKWHACNGLYKKKVILSAIK